MRSCSHWFGLLGCGIASLASCSSSAPAPSPSASASASLLPVDSAPVDSAPGPASEAEAVRPSIVNGTESDASQDGIVLVMQYDAFAKDGGAQNGCTGSLLTPRLVLTARHCVAATDPGAQCTSKGTAVSGGKVQGDYPASTIYVFAGKDRPDYLSGAVQLAKGQEILTTGAETLCDQDIALVVLDRPLPGGKPVPIKLDAMPAVGSKVTVVGWGITESSPNPPTRRQRTDVEILKVGPESGVGPTEFVIGEGTCDGDSGGPAIASSGAVLGALSRGGNGSSARGADNCIGATHIFTSAFGHADFIRRGYERVGADPWLEGQPSPPLTRSGGTCVVDAECQSNTCDQTSKTCTDRLPSNDGCAVAPHTASRRSQSRTPSSSLALYALAVLFACVRRKK